MMTDVAAPVLTFTRTIHAPVSQVYRSFIDRDWVTYWFSDDAHTRPEVGGHFLLTWNTGYYAVGSFVELEADKKIVLNWRGAGETTDSRIEINLDAQGDSVVVNVEYSDFNFEAADAIQREWENRLDNLVSALEKGEDQRITNRVILGIYPGNVTDADRKNNNIAENAAMKVGGLIPGYSAEAAGLLTDDIITEINGQTITNTLPSFVILANSVPGDVVSVTFYRSSEKHETTITLKGYPLPQKVADYGELADRVKAMDEADYAEIAALITTAGEETASKKPAEGEWSAKEVLAHLTLHERWLQTWMGIQVQGPEQTAYVANHPALIAAFLEIYPTTADVLAELRRSYNHTVAILRNFKTNGSERKAHLWWATFQIDTLRNHTRQHIDQIKAALQ